MAGQKEYEVELQFTSGILSYPSRTNIDEENIDGEEPIFGSRMDLKSQSPSSSRRGSKISMVGWVYEYCAHYCISMYMLQVKIKFLCLLTLLIHWLWIIRVRRQRKLRTKPG